MAAVAPSSTFSYLGHELDVAMVQEVARSAKRKLTPAKIEGLTGPKLFGDGGGLWLQIAPGNGRSWVFRYSVAGRPKNMGLGSLHEIPSLTVRNVMCGLQEKLKARAAWGASLVSRLA